MGKEWVYFLGWISLCLSAEKGRQILFLILCGLKSVQSIPNWYSFLTSHGPEQSSGTILSLFKILEAHLFFCMDHTCNLIEIGHKGFCGLTLFAVHQVTSCRTLYVRDGLHSDLLLIKGQGLMADFIHTVEASPGPDLADELACTGNHPQLQ